MRGYITLREQTISIGGQIVVQCVFVRKTYHQYGLIRWNKLFREVKRIAPNSWQEVL